MIKIIFVLFSILFTPSFIYAQLLPKYPREMNANYAYTKFNDSFSGTSLDTDKWQVVTNYGRGKCVFVDSVGTTYSVNNGLSLSMIYHPGYCFNDGGINCPDYISAEIVSKDKFKYGIYEGRMKFASGKGSWPAFWFYGGSGADDPQYNTGFASEIDIAEYNWHKKDWPSSGYTVHTDHVFHWWWPQSIHGTREMDIPNGIKNNDVDWNNSHTFKLIYTPYDCTFYIDSVFSWRRSRYYTLVNGSPQDIFPENINANTSYSEWEWFPKHEGQIILSQQVSGNVWNGDISAPQTSLFEWVTFKQFFLAPEITCPQIICSSGTATMDVDPAATNISWALSPGYLFNGAIAGTGNTANIYVSASGQGKGKITYTFNMPSGETFTAEKEIWVGAPVISGISGPTSTPNNQWATYTAQLASDLSAPTAYNWILNPVNGNSVYNYGNTCDIAFYNTGTYQLVVQAKNVCSGSGYGLYYVTGLSVYNPYRLTVSPNPSTSETTISLFLENNELARMTTSWDYEIYDSFQGLKEKKAKLKTNETKINTSGWKDGVYIVRVTIGDKVLTEKMLVKH